MTISNDSFATQLASLLGFDSTKTQQLVDLVDSWDPNTPADLADLINTFVNASSNRDTAYNNWAVGTPTGGDGSGNYSIPLLGGGSISQPSIAKLLQLVQHGADAKTGLAFDCLGPWNPGERLQMLVVPGPLVIDTANIAGVARVAAAANATVTFNKNGVAWGSVTFAGGTSGANTAVTQSFSSNTVSRRDYIEMFGPASGDATFADFAITLPGVSS